MTATTRRPMTIPAILAATTLFILVLAGANPSNAAAACQKTWAGGSGNWHDAANWIPSGVPGGGDDVCITADGTYTVTIMVREGTINEFSGGADELTLGGNSGTQTIAVVGNFANGVSNTASLSATTGTINSHGAITFSSNDPGSDANLCAGDPGLTNDGTITWNGGGGSRTMQGKVTNGATGAFNVNTNLTIPGTHSCGSNGLTNNGGSVSVANGANFTDQESFAQSAGTTTVNGTMNAQGTFNMTGGSFTGTKPSSTSLSTCRPRPVAARSSSTATPRSTPASLRGST